MPVEQLTAESSEVDQFRDLSPQERLFCFKYLETFNHGDAAEEVGYSRKAGKRLLYKPLVAKFLNHLLKDQEQYLIINRQYVQALMIDLEEKLDGRVEVPMVTEKGESFFAKKFHAPEYTRLVLAMAKQAGLQVEDPKKGNVIVNFNMGALGIDGSAQQVSVTVEGESTTVEPIRDYIEVNEDGSIAE